MLIFLYLIFFIYISAKRASKAIHSIIRSRQLKMFAPLQNLVLFFCVSFCYCGIFDFADLNDRFSYMWNNRYLHSTQVKCNANLDDGTTIQGVCKTKAECSVSGGVPRGRCGILSTCCTYERSCGRTVGSKVSYFTSGNIALQQDTLCSYHVQLMNDNVCQIRLDFIDFHTASAQMKVVENLEKAYICIQDNFYTNPRSRIPSICGYNTGQHLYMHLPRSSTNISLHMKITPRTTNVPRWNIKVTQLECPKNGNRKTSTNLPLVDVELLAPPGCLQYNTEIFGNFKSFGFDETNTGNVYIANQHYSICFKRFGDTCGINYNVKYLNLMYSGYNPIIDVTCTSDYLFIPGLVSFPGYIAKVCGQVAPANSDLRILSNPPGPLHVDFYANEYIGSPVDELNGGFNINYELQRC